MGNKLSIRKSVPVTPVTWFEANAYCKWLMKHWMELDGGDQPKNRFPWDRTGKATSEFQEIRERANTSEGDLKKTTPVSTLL